MLALDDRIFYILPTMISEDINGVGADDNPGVRAHKDLTPFFKRVDGLGASMKRSFHTSWQGGASCEHER